MANAVVNTVKREFVIEHQRTYNHAGPVRWILSHALRYRLLVALFLLGTLLSVVTNSAIPDVIGAAFNGVLAPRPQPELVLIYALAILALYVANFLTTIVGAFGIEILGQRLEADARDELYLNLLGKSQTFHNQQRVGDIMARANNDVRQLNGMMNPGASLVLSDSILSLIVPIIFIALLNPQLLLAPLLFTVAFVLAVRRYTRELAPVSAAMRDRFGALNAGLTESITGIEVVKATGQEAQERGKFTTNARAYRDHFIQNGQVQARYLPLLLFALAMVVAFLHGLLLVNRGELNIGNLVAYLALMGLLAIPANTSIWAFNLIQMGLAGADRILELLRQESDLDENASGYTAPMRGELTFEDVSFQLRRRAGAARSLVYDSPRRDARHRGADRRGQEHPHQAGQPHLRRDERARAGGRRGRARLEPGRFALADLDHRAGHLPLLALHRREHRLRPGTTRRRK